MVGDNWENPDQASLPRLRGILANEIPFMPGGAARTLGLPGRVQLTGPRDYPAFALDESLDHPFAVEQREGIYAERLLEYLSPVLHDS
jgi:hypothetical protein